MAAEQGTLASRLIGAWSLVSIEIRWSDGTVERPMGHSPSGRFIFGADGNYAVQLMDRDPGSAGYVASWGTYTVSETEQCFVLTLEGSLLRASVGTTARRTVTWSEDTAVFTSDADVVAGIESRYVIVWRRA
jgi:hypothetical protein